MISVQTLESEFQLSRIFQKNFVTFCPMLQFWLPQTSQTVFSYSPSQTLLLLQNLLYLKNQNEAIALANFFLYGHLKANVPSFYQIKMIGMFQGNSSKLEKDMRIITQVIKTPYYGLPKTNRNHLFFIYFYAIIAGTFSLGMLIFLYRNGYLTKKQFYLLLTEIRNRTWGFFKFLYLFLSKLFRQFKIGTLPEKIISKTMDSDSSLPLPIDVLSEVEEFLEDINDMAQCKRFILHMMRFGETGVVQVSEYKDILKLLRRLRKMGKEYETDGKTHLIPEILEKIDFSKKTLTILGTSIQRIARVFLRKTRYYTSCLNANPDLEALDDALFDRIQEIFEIFIAFSKKYGIELNE